MMETAAMKEGWKLSLIKPNCIIMPAASMIRRYLKCLKLSTHSNRNTLLNSAKLLKPKQIRYQHFRSRTQTDLENN